MTTGMRRRATELVCECRSQGAVFPLSAIHYMEIAPIVNRRHRRDLVNIIEELSGFAVLVSSAVIQLLELEAALDTFGRPRALRRTGRVYGPARWE